MLSEKIIAFETQLQTFLLNRVTGVPESLRCSVEEKVVRGTSSQFRRVSHAMRH